MKSRARRILSTPLVAMLLAACGGGLSGTYVKKSAGGFDVTDVKVEFKDGGKANLTIGALGMNQTIEVGYAISGKEVKLGAPTGSIVGKIRDDGCLEFGTAMGVLCREQVSRRVESKSSASVSQSGRAGANESPAVKAMKSDLRNLVSAEESYYSDHSKYTDHPPSLGFVQSNGVSAPSIKLSAGGAWTATNESVQQPGTMCGIGVNTRNPVDPKAPEGEPACR